MQGLYADHPKAASTMLTMLRVNSWLASLAAAVFVLCLAGCTHVQIQSGVARLGGNPWTHHGLLRIGDSRVPGNLNRMLGTLTVESEIASLFCAQLFRVDDHEQLQPELALAEPTMRNHGISDNGRTITYHLRSGVQWQDGAPFTASDVAFSWQQVTNPRNLVQSQDYYNQVDRIATPDMHTAIIRLKRPQAGFTDVFFTDYCIVPKHLLQGFASLNHADYNRLPLGTGPFRIVENEPGVFMKFVANPHYWRGAPKLKEIDYYIIPDPITLLTQVRTHELDLYHDVATEQAMQLAAIPGTTVYQYPFSGFTDLGFNGGRAPISDKRVRQALAYATDVRRVVNDVAHGQAIIADSDQPPWRWTYDRAAKHYPYDPGRAAALLDAAGWKAGPNGIRVKDGRPLLLTFVGSSGDPTVQRAETILQQQWRAVGVDASIHNFSANVLYALGTGVEQSGNFDVSIENWQMSVDPDNIQLYGCRMAPPNGWNVYHYCDPDLDRAEIVARGSYDRRARQAAYAKIQESITEGLPFYVLWYGKHEDLANSDLRGYRPGRTESAFWNPWEWSI